MEWHLTLETPLLQALGTLISLHPIESFKVEVAIGVRADGDVGQTAFSKLFCQELEALKLGLRHQVL